jgi:hypothetical protein
MWCAIARKSGLPDRLVWLSGVMVVLFLILPEEWGGLLGLSVGGTFSSGLLSQALGGLFFLSWVWCQVGPIQTVRRTLVSGGLLALTLLTNVHLLVPVGIVWSVFLCARCARGVDVVARMLGIAHGVEEVGITVEDVMASPIALSFVTLSKSQKIAGCVLANIGSETTSISVFENNTPVSMEVFPIGGSDITNDIALGIKVPIEEAEQIKIGAITGSSYSRKKLEEIVEARLSDIFELIESHLKKLGRNGLLPAGIILSGGGSMLSGIEDLAKDSLSIPARIGSIELKLQDKNNYKDMLFGVAYGLCVLGINIDEETSIDTSSQFLTKTGKAIATWIKQFLP